MAGGVEALHLRNQPWAWEKPREPPEPPGKEKEKAAETGICATWQGSGEAYSREALWQAPHSQALARRAVDL